VLLPLIRPCQVDVAAVRSGRRSLADAAAPGAAKGPEPAARSAVAQPADHMSLRCAHSACRSDVFTPSREPLTVPVEALVL